MGSFLLIECDDEETKKTGHGRHGRSDTFKEGGDSVSSRKRLWTPEEIANYKHTRSEMKRINALNLEKPLVQGLSTTKSIRKPLDKIVVDSRSAAATAMVARNKAIALTSFRLAGHHYNIKTSKDRIWAFDRDGNRIWLPGIKPFATIPTSWTVKMLLATPGWFKYLKPGKR